MIIVAALYRFTHFSDPAALCAPVRRLAQANGVRGSLLLAHEGINGTIAGTREGIDVMQAHFRALPGCGDLDWKESRAAVMPFGRLKLRVKPEIVTLRQPDVDPRARVGHYVAPAEWNALITAPDVVTIDTRNAYEVAIGSFQGAIDPGTHSFADFPDWWRKHGRAFEGRRIAMFCTGGIRCEKATNWLLGQGVEAVFHLKGGILKYLEDVPADDSLWSGECFVFDQRVSIGHGLVQGRYLVCHACRRPVAPEQIDHPDYEEGASCPACIEAYTDADRMRFRERAHQLRLAAARGIDHFGPGG